MIGFSQTEFVGNWEVYDTLSIETTKLGSMSINKVKLYHKKLKLNSDATFNLHHIEPKGFFIDANVIGEWKKEVDGVTLIYEDEFKDQNGNVSLKKIEQKLLYSKEGELVVNTYDKKMKYLKK